jgi:two-component system, chemotaxis family, sensor kinase CheA
MNEFLQQFLIESRELVLQATEGLLLLEKSPHDAERLDSVFRAFHTLKGGAGIVEYAAMEHAVHSTENLLVEVRSGRQALSSDLVSHCLARLDQVSRWLDSLEQTGELPSGAAVPSGNGAGAVCVPDAVSVGARSGLSAPAAPDWVTDLVRRHQGAAGRAATAFRFTPDSDCFYKGEDPIARIVSLNELLALEAEPAAPWPPLNEFDSYACNLVLTGLTGSAIDDVAVHLGDHSGECELLSIGAAATAAARVPLPDIVRDILAEQVAVLDEKEAAGAAGRLASAGSTAANAMRFCGRDSDAEALVRATREGLAGKSPQTLRDAIAQLLAPEATAPSLVSQAPPKSTNTSGRTLRIDSGQIDALVRLTGELIVAKNAIGHTAKLAQQNGDSTASQLRAHHRVLDRLILQLQNSAIGMRVLPLRSVFQRFPRVLREMSASLGKPAELRLEGENTEADKAIVEMLFEPLLHLVRNAIDHGVEDSENRRKKGKPAIATVRMRAARDGDQILIEVSDDGAGIDVERVRTVAIERGVVTDEALKDRSDSQIIELVFAPGFSTAAQLTEISGRGVGMDAVRTAVERFGGRVSIASLPGRGTTVSLSLPFSVLMTQVMTVEAGGQVFGIPLDAIVETVRVAKGAFAGVGGARVIVQRNRTIPVVELKGVLNGGLDIELRDEADATVVIAAVGGQLVGIHVDHPGERMDVILKPLDGLMTGTRGIAGTTVLGDGRVLLVLDIAEMLQ